jgi:phosphohistidine phosphatase SixA
MSPKTILIMRHAEKLQDPTNPNLSPTGETRAGNLVAWVPETFGRPDYLFASSISKHSARPYETLKPLAKAIGVPIDATFADQDYGALAQELLADERYGGKMVLVCWHHGNIPSLAADLNAPPNSYPDPWRGSVFNEVLRLDYDAAGNVRVTPVLEPF